MRMRFLFVLCAALLVAGGVVAAQSGAATAQEKGQMEMKGKMEMKMPFGGPTDVAFAGKLWTAMRDYRSWPVTSDYHASKAPHGSIVRIYYNVVTIDGKPYHVIAKDNFGGEGATMESVAATPADYLKAVTVMVQMPPGYDSEHNDWFYVKYDSSGMIDMKGDMAMAGRVGDGTTASCIGCHLKAGGGDYIFFND